MTAKTETKTVPLGTMLGLVMETLRVLNEKAGRNDIGSQTVITFLAVAQSAEELPQSQLMLATGLTQAGVSRNVSRLSTGTPSDPGLGLVEQYEDPYNRRSKLLKLTPQGKAVVSEIYRRAGKFCAIAAKQMEGK